MGATLLNMKSYIFILIHIHIKLYIESHLYAKPQLNIIVREEYKLIADGLRLLFSFFKLY